MKKPNCDSKQAFPGLVLVMVLALLLPIRTLAERDPPPPCSVTGESTTCVTPASLALEAPTNSPLIACVGTEIIMSATESNILGIVETTRTYDRCEPNVWQDNTVVTIVSNWWTVSGPGGFTTNGSGLEAKFGPTNAGSGTVTFYSSYSNSLPCTNSGTTTTNGAFTIVQTAVKSVEFTSDHGVMLTNNVDWMDNGVLYPSPEWIANSSTNSPITHTKNQTIQMTVKVIVKPAGLTFKLQGTGPDAYVSFLSGDNLSTGSEQDVSVTANAPLPNIVTILADKTIAWSIVVNGTNLSCGSASSGPHKIYVTYGTPETPDGLGRTEMRIKDVCQAADGGSTLDGCASKIFYHLNSNAFNLQAPFYGPQPIWLMHDSNTNVASQCPGLAKYILRHFQMLGMGDGQIVFCRIFPDGTFSYIDSQSPLNNSSPQITTNGVYIYRSCVAPNFGHQTSTGHDAHNPLENLGGLDGNTNFNHFEAACLFNQKFYAVGVGIYNTPRQVVEGAFGTNLGWYYQHTSDPQKGLPCGTSPWPGP